MDSQQHPNAAPQVAQRFASLDHRESVQDYNFQHFRSKHFLADLWATLKKRGIRPGEQAPDFELPRVGDSTGTVVGDGPGRSSLRLSELRGKPAVLHFGSFT